MKKSRTLVALVLVFAMILSTGSVFAATTGYSDLSGGYFGYYLDKNIDTSVSDGVLTATQNADKIYNYPDTEDNLFKNSGFETSSIVNSAAKFAGWNELTSGWASSSDIWNSRLEVKITNDSHSGKNALSIKRLADNTVNGSPVNLYNLDAVKNSLDEVDTNKTLRDGTITGLTSGTEYIYSFWVKGNAISRLQYREYAADGAHTVASKNYSDEELMDKWELITVVIEADSAGVWANTFFPSDKNSNTNVTIGDYIIVDDIQFMTVSNAEAMVKQMITDLDIESPTAARAIDDIEQWCKKLSLTKTDEYAEFESKKSDYNSLLNPVYTYEDNNNILSNPGFEESDEVHNEPYLNSSEILVTPITKEWHTATEVRDTRTFFTMVSDAHSGSNAFKISRTADTKASTVRMYNTASSDTTTYTVEKEKDYIISYWVKGNGRTSIRYWADPTGTSSSTNGTTATYYTDAVKQNKWELVTKVLRSDANGLIKFGIDFDNSDTNVYAIIDDIQLTTLEDAKANVHSMIKNLKNIPSNNYTRALDDIQQWIARLDDADLNKAYNDIVIDQMANIITPNTGYTGLEVGEYYASVTLKGQGNVDILCGNAGETVKLTDEWTTSHLLIPVGDDGEAFFGVQLLDTTDINTVCIKDFSLVKLENGDANFDKQVDIRDIVRLRAKLANDDVEISGVADANADGEFTAADIKAIRDIILEIAG